MLSGGVNKFEIRVDVKFLAKLKWKAVKMISASQHFCGDPSPSEPLTAKKKFLIILQRRNSLMDSPSLKKKNINFFHNYFIPIQVELFDFLTTYWLLAALLAVVSRSTCPTTTGRHSCLSQKSFSFQRPSSRKARSRSSPSFTTAQQTTGGWVTVFSIFQFHLVVLFWLDFVVITSAFTISGSCLETFFYQSTSVNWPLTLNNNFFYDIQK